MPWHGSRMNAKVRRFERFTIDAKDFKTEAGFLRAPVRLGRVGVLTYQHADGTSHRELRLPAEVFDEKSVASFEMIPAVDSHPFENNGVVTPENARRLQVGMVGHVRQDAKDSSWLSGVISVTDGDTIKKIQSGKVEISLGYFADREPAQPGAKFLDPVTGTEEPYDFIQRGIVGNHVAIVDVARAGPGARIQLDGLDAIATDPRSPTQNAVQNETKPIMPKINLDGIDYEVQPQLAQAIEKLKASHKITVDGLSGDLTATKSQLTKAQNDLAAANDPKRLADSVTERVGLEKTADVHGVAHAGLSNADVRKAVIGKIDSEIKLDGQSDVFVNGVFSALTKAAAKGNPAANALNAAAGNGPTLDAAQANGKTREASFNKAIFAQDAATVLFK